MIGSEFKLCVSVCVWLAPFAPLAQGGAGELALPASLPAGVGCSSAGGQERRCVK